MNKKPFIFGIVCFLVIAAVIAGIIYAIFQAIKDDAKETVLAPEPREGLTKMYVFGGGRQVSRMMLSCPTGKGTTQSATLGPQSNLCRPREFPTRWGV